MAQQTLNREWKLKRPSIQSSLLSSQEPFKVRRLAKRYRDRQQHRQEIPRTIVRRAPQPYQTPLLVHPKDAGLLQHHLALPVYPALRPLHPRPQSFARMFRDKTTSTLFEARYAPQQAEAQKGWDPITWSVATRKDLEMWAAWLDMHEVKRSPIFTAIKSWVMGCEDSDGRIVRLYVVGEEHEWTDHPDQDEEWLGSVEADPGLVEG